MKGIEKRIRAIEARQPTEKDFRKSPGYSAYKDTLIKCLADYPQKGLLEDVQRAFVDLEGRSGPVTDADVFYAIDPLMRKHREEFAPNPQKAEHLALIARFKAMGARDEDLEDFYKYVRRYEEEDKHRAAAKCFDCGIDIRETPHHWDLRWREGELETVPWCQSCHRKHYPGYR